jgi:hypothetical protein
MFWFNRDRKRVELQATVRRIVDLTLPPMNEVTVRTEQRFDRSLPVLIAPWESGKPLVDQASIAVTKDLSDHGVAVIVTEPWNVSEVVVAFQIFNRQAGAVRTETDAIFIRASVRNLFSMGGGRWQLGLYLEEVVKCDKALAALRPLATALLPHPVDHPLEPALEPRR